MNPNSTVNPPLDLDQLGSLESRMSRGVPAAIEHWDRACVSLCAWEKEHLDIDSTHEELTQHDKWLSDLLSWGRAIQKETGRADFPDKPLANSVEERVGHLEDKYGVWHSGMTSEDENRVIDAAYD